MHLCSIYLYIVIDFMPNGAMPHTPIFLFQCTNISGTMFNISTNVQYFHKYSIFPPMFNISTNFQYFHKFLIFPQMINISTNVQSVHQCSILYSFIEKYCFSNLHWIHWVIPWWSDSALYSNIIFMTMFNISTNVQYFHKRPIFPPVGAKYPTCSCFQWVSKHWGCIQYHSSH